MAILATLLLAMAMDMVLAMVHMDMESVRLRQRLMPMLSMDHMESTVLDIALILWDMVMAILPTAMDMVWAMAVMGMESAMLNQSLMLSMEPMVGMAMDLDTVHTPWDMDMDMVMDLAMVWLWTWTPYILPWIWTWIWSWIWLWYGYGLGHRTYSLGYGHGYGHGFGYGMAMDLDTVHTPL